jgi:hypothetical protein
MSWKQLLAARKVHTHQTSKQELDELRAVIRRDLSDATIPALSEDRRFATAYNAALQTAKMAIACAGYRVGAVPGHHAISFECAGLALGKQADALVGFFDVSRRKRNIIDYTGAQVRQAMVRVWTLFEQTSPNRPLPRKPLEILAEH